MTSCLLGAKFRWIAASYSEIEVMRICSVGLRTAEAETVHIRSAVDPVEVTYTKVKPISSAGMAEP